MVIDSNDHQRISYSREELWRMLEHEDLRKVCCYFFLFALLDEPSFLGICIDIRKQTRHQGMHDCGANF